jgi:hypothetical protein
MSIMRASLVLASLLAAQASEATCTGAGCAVEDEVSLMQVKIEQHGAPGTSCTWDGNGEVPSAAFICAKCPKVLQVASASGLQLEVKRDPKALFTKAGKCFERATMTDAAHPTATGQQFQCSRAPSFAGPCTKDNEDACVCHLGTKGEGMTFKEMVAGFKKTVKGAIAKDEQKGGGDFSHSEEEGQICNWDGSGEVPEDKFICSTCPKVKKVLAAKGKLGAAGVTYSIHHAKSSTSLYTSDADCFEGGSMVNDANPTETPTNFQCRRSILFMGDCTEANEENCDCALGMRGDGATFKDLAEAIKKEAKE